MIYSGSLSPEEVCIGCFNQESVKTFSHMKYFKWPIPHCLGPFQGCMSVQESNHGQVQNKHLLRCYPECRRYPGSFYKSAALGRFGQSIFLPFCFWMQNSSRVVVTKHCQLCSDEGKYWQKDFTCFWFRLCNVFTHSHAHNGGESPISFIITPPILGLARVFARNMHFQTTLTPSYPFDSIWTSTAVLGNLRSLQQVQPSPVLLHSYARACKTGWYVALSIALGRGAFSLMHARAIMCCDHQQSFLFKIVLPFHVTSKDQ